MIITLCTELSPRYSMLQTGAANQSKHPIVSFRTRAASAGDFYTGGWLCRPTKRLIASGCGLSDNGARILRDDAYSDESFSAAQRIYCAAAGRAADLAGCDGANRAAGASGRRRRAGGDLPLLGCTSGYAARGESGATGDHDSRRIARARGYPDSLRAVRAGAAYVAAVYAGRGRTGLAWRTGRGGFGRAPLISPQPTESKTSAFALASRARSG